MQNITHNGIVLTVESLHSLTIPKLKEVADSLALTYRSKILKGDLIALILTAAPDEKPETPKRAVSENTLTMFQEAAKRERKAHHECDHQDGHDAPQNRAQRRAAKRSQHMRPDGVQKRTNGEVRPQRKHYVPGFQPQH